MKTRERLPSVRLPSVRPYAVTPGVGGASPGWASLATSLKHDQGRRLSASCLWRELYRACCPYCACCCLVAVFGAVLLVASLLTFCVRRAQVASFGLGSSSFRLFKKNLNATRRALSE